MSPESVSPSFKLFFPKRPPRAFSLLNYRAARGFGRWGSRGGQAGVPRSLPALARRAVTQTGPLLVPLTSFPL